MIESSVDETNAPIALSIARKNLPPEKTTEETGGDLVESAVFSSPSPLGSEWDEWRTVPNGAPSLLLARSHHLDLQDPGPVLEPGVSYRVDGFRNGIVALRTLHRDGSTGFGFCNSVDLICIDRRFGADRAGSSPRRVFSGSLSRMTSFVGRPFRDRT
jgi:hypothetical protein